jgi:Gpi18-like mannosyltransferase
LAACNRTTVEYGKNLLDNPHIERESAMSSSIPGWTRSETGTITWDQISGGSSHNFPTMIFRLDNAGVNFSYVSQRVDVERGAYYRLSGWIQVNRAFSSMSGAFIGILEDTDFVLRQGTDFQNVQNDFVQYVVYFQNVNFSSINIIAAVGLERDQSDGAAYFAGLSLEKVAEDTIAMGTIIHPLVRNRFGMGLADGFSMTSVILLTFATIAVLAYAYYLIKKNLKQDELSKFSKKESKSKGKLSSQTVFLLILAGAFVIRFLMQILVEGHLMEIRHLSEIAIRLAGGNWGTAYNQNTTIIQGSVTPGYMYILSLLGLFANWTGINPDNIGMAVLIKLPAIIADIIAVAVIFNMAMRYSKRASYAYIWAGLYAFLPTIFFASAGWGSAESFLGLFLLLALNAGLQKKFVSSTIFFTLAIVFSALAVHFIPLFAIFIGYSAYKYELERKKIIVTAAACFLGWFGIAIPFITGNMFGINGQFFFLFTLYNSFIKVWTGGAFSPAVRNTTQNAFNVFGLFNRNMIHYEDIAGTFSIIVILTILTAVVMMFWKKKNRADLLLLTAFAFAMLHTFTVGMTPTSMIFMLVLMLAYVVITNERRVFYCFAGFSVLKLLNMAQIMSISGYLGGSIIQRPENFSPNDPLMIIGSLIMVFLTLYFAFVTYDISYKNRLKFILPLGNYQEDGIAMQFIRKIYVKQK